MNKQQKANKRADKKKRQQDRDAERLRRRVAEAKRQRSEDYAELPLGTFLDVWS